jgi:hypothetical protein
LFDQVVLDTLVELNDKNDFETKDDVYIFYPAGLGHHILSLKNGRIIGREI